MKTIKIVVEIPVQFLQDEYRSRDLVTSIAEKEFYKQYRKQFVSKKVEKLNDKTQPK